MEDGRDAELLEDERELDELRYDDRELDHDRDELLLRNELDLKPRAQAESVSGAASARTSASVIPPTAGISHRCKRLILVLPQRTA